MRLRTGIVYLAVLLDAWSRRVVGYAVGNMLTVQLTLAALNAAVESRRPKPGLIHQSDRGSQCAARPYRNRLEALGIRGSMSRKANPYDSALAESFMKTLKHEEVLAFDYDTIDDAKARLPRFPGGRPIRCNSGETGAQIGPFPPSRSLQPGSC